MQALIGLWTLVLFIVLLNGFSAGVVAGLHVWRRRQRILAAAAVAGLVPAAIAVPSRLIDISVGTQAPFALVVSIAVMSLVTMAASLPGAMIIARKLDGPGNAHMVFE